jgi:hypothetical protein
MKKWIGNCVKCGWPKENGTEPEGNQQIAWVMVKKINQLSNNTKLKEINGKELNCLDLHSAGN